MWPGGQIVPDESRCYIPIFDGLVFIDYGSESSDNAISHIQYQEHLEGKQATHQHGHKFHFLGTPAAAQTCCGRTQRTWCG